VATVPTPVYWLTQSIGTSMRYYAEWFGKPWVPDHDRQPALEAPTGIAVVTGSGRGIRRGIAIGLADAAPTCS
jgi:hypothetical protein